MVWWRVWGSHRRKQTRRWGGQYSTLYCFYVATRWLDPSLLRLCPRENLLALVSKSSKILLTLLISRKLFFFFTIWVLLFNGQNPKSKAIQKANRTSPKPNRKNQKTREKHKGKAQKRNPPKLHQFTQHVERHLLEPQQRGNTCHHFPSSFPPPEKHELFRRNLVGKHMQLPIVFTDRTSPPD